MDSQKAPRSPSSISQVLWFSAVESRSKCLQPDWLWCHVSKNRTVRLAYLTGIVSKFCFVSTFWWNRSADCFGLIVKVVYTSALLKACLGFIFWETDVLAEMQFLPLRSRQMEICNSMEMLKVPTSRFLNEIIFFKALLQTYVECCSECWEYQQIVMARCWPAVWL